MSRPASSNQDVTSNTSVIEGTDNNDALQGDSGDNVMRGLDGNDVLKGGAGNDTLIGGRGTDQLAGGAGYDVFTFSPGDGDDTIEDFKPGTDKIDLSGFSQGIAWFDLRWNMEATSEGVKIDLSKWGGGSITLTGVNSPNELYKSMFVLGDPSVDLTGGSDADVLMGSAENDRISGGGGGDTLYGYNGVDKLKGDGGNDLILGGQGNDHIWGGAGDDILYGDGIHADTHYRDGTQTWEPDGDTFYYSPGDGNDKIMDFYRTDKIDLTAFTDITGFDDISARQDGNNVVIDFSDNGGGSITLVDFNLDYLDASDFEFHSSSVDTG